MKLTVKKAHILTIIVGAIFVSLSIFHTNLWFDESYSVAIARHSFSEIWTIGGNDVHPILYYWMLHIIQIITGGSIVAYRIFSAIPIIILGILGFTHIRKDFGEKEGFIFSLLTYFMPAMSVYTNQIRMYSWSILTVTILAIYAYRIFKGKDSNKNIIIFGISSLFSIYLHYYGLMSAGIINAILLIYLIIKKRKYTAIKITLLGILQLIAYVPWLINFATQLKNVSGGFWIGFEFPKTLIELISFGFLGDYINGNFGLYQHIIFVLTIELYIYLGIKIYKYKKEKQDINSAILSVIIYFAVIIAALLITFVMKTSILYYRYLFVITGLFIFVLSFVLAKEKNKKILIAICTLIVLLGMINNIKLINENYDQSNKKPIEYLKQNIQEGDIIVYSDIGVGAVVNEFLNSNREYFYNADHWNIYEAYKAYEPTMEITENDEFTNQANRFWLVGYNENIYNYLFNNEKYSRISTEAFDTKYQNNYYIIMLVEKKM